MAASWRVLFVIRYQILLCALVGTSLALLQTGCASMRTVIVDIEFNVQIDWRDSAGKLSHAPPSEFIKLRHPQAASPHPNVHYVGGVLEWRISASVSDLGYFMRSNVAGPVCLRFDQASMTSSMQAKAIPVRVSWAEYGALPGPLDTIRNTGKENLLFPAPKVCAARGDGSTFGFVLAMNTLFPSGKMFNINQSGQELNYSERGAGNWLKLHVPVEYLGKRETLEVTLTAVNSQARFSYH